MYHECGSKRLAETSNANGFCASYSEVQRYLTIVTNHEIERIQDCVYVT